MVHLEEMGLGSDLQLLSHPSSWEIKVREAQETP